MSIVATPIGNLGDITHRGVDRLASATVIACEDTRRTSALLRSLGIQRAPMVVLNDHTERSVVDRLIGQALAGDNVVLVSDAGMPAISDPGWLLVRAAIAADVDIEVVPGASAVLAALVVSGLATDRFVFDGFLPRKGAERAVRIADVADQPRTTVLYEAPHRLERTLADLLAACGPERQVAVVRELTKLYEEVWRGPLDGALQWCQSSNPRGEIVIVVEGAAPVAVDDESLMHEVRQLRADGASLRDAVDTVATSNGVRRRRVYTLALDDQ